MEKVRFIGDIHGKFMTYWNLLDGVYENVGGGKAAKRSVQVGDYGLGFNSDTDARALGWAEANCGHKFIRGNHDSPDVCKLTKNWIEDGTYDADHGVLYIGGAWSIDRHYRTPGVDWWFDEEVSYEKLQALTEQFSVLKPKIVVTHDAPTWVAYEMFLKQMSNPYHVKTRTGEALQEMFDSWKPELHIFGHWHHTKVSNIDGTTFVCLGELAYMDVDLETAQITTWPRARNHAGHWVEIPKSDNY
jgi:Icc-related predicted phosphoesterase